MSNHPGNQKILEETEAGLCKIIVHVIRLMSVYKMIEPMQPTQEMGKLSAADTSPIHVCGVHAKTEMMDAIPIPKPGSKQFLHPYFRP